MERSRHPSGHTGHPGHDHEHEHEHGAGWWARVRHALIPHGHDHTEAIRSAEEATSIGIRAAWIGLAGMAATAVLQLLVVALSGSVSLLADTMHNLGHLATTIPLLIAFRLGRRAPTRRHPYGFRRAEDLVGLLIGAVIALSAALIVWESLRALSTNRDLTHLGWVLAAACIGAAGNELVARYRIRAGRRIGSAALVAEGRHARTDALTSLAVILGVAGAWLGLPWVDPVIGLVIAAVIVGILVQSMRTVVHRLMDGVEPATTIDLEQAAAGAPGVSGVGAVRARWIGHRLEADLVVHVEGGLTVEAGHRISRAVARHLHSAVPHLDRATVAIEAAPHPGHDRVGQTSER